MPSFVQAEQDLAYMNRQRQEALQDLRDENEFLNEDIRNHQYASTFVVTLLSQCHNQNRVHVPVPACHHLVAALLC